MLRRLGIFLLLVLAAAGAFTAWVRWEISRPYKGYAAPSTFVDVPRGTSRRGIAALLQQNGVVRSRMAFEAYSRWERRRTLQAGEYLFDQPVSARDVFWRIAAGRVYVHMVTIPEGWTMFDVADALEREGLCRRDDFLAAARDPSLVRDLAPAARTLEGFLFPATYGFSQHTTPKEIAATMVEHFRTVWAALAQSGDPAAAPGSTVNSPPVEKVVDMASLVERETPRPEERPLVAGVFYNRLNRGYPLQCDPTVQYALASAGRPAQPLRPEDLSFHSPYNTYLHRGLPPGPIANPGEASLRAALDPAHTDYLYFVANAQGGHFFSSTLAEHNRNVARYRRLLAGLPDLPPPSAAPPIRRSKTHGRRP